MDAIDMNGRTILRQATFNSGSPSQRQPLDKESLALAPDPSTCPDSIYRCFRTRPVRSSLRRSEPHA